MKEKPKNKTVAMRFRLKNFKEIEPILKKHKIKTETILNVTEYPYLISHRYRNKLSVHNETLTHARFYFDSDEIKVYSKWDANIFLKALGINSKENQLIEIL